MKRNKKGFTIVELVIVIGVIAILSAILIPTFVNLANKAEDARAKSEVADAYTAYVLDYSDDKKANSFDGAEGTESTALIDKKQDEVTIRRDGLYYHYIAGSDGGWASYTPAATDGTFTSVVTGDTSFAALYNGCAVGYFVAA